MATPQDTGGLSTEYKLEGLCDSIEKKKGEEYWWSLDDAEKGEVLGLELQPHYKPSHNVLSFAIHSENFEAVLAMLEDVCPENPDKAPWIKAFKSLDHDENNSIQKLILVYNERSINDPKIESCIKQVFVKMVEVAKGCLDVLVNRNKQGHTVLHQALFWPDKSKHPPKWFEMLWSVLPDNSEKAKMMRQIGELCNRECDKTGKESEHHHRDCCYGYDLLTLAIHLDDQKSYEIMKRFLDGMSKKEQTECILNSQSDNFNSAANSIRVAAYKGKWEWLEDLLNLIPLNDGLAGVLLAGDSRLQTAFKWIIQSGQHSLLEYCNRDFSVQNNPALRCAILDHEMPFAATKFLNKEMNAFKSSFAIPKPSCQDGFSQPVAMICYNTYPNLEEKKRLPQTKTVAYKIKKSLEYLDWPVKAIEMESNWPTDGLCSSIERKLQSTKTTASIFFLCIISHGADDQVLGIASTVQPSEDSSQSFPEDDRDGETPGLNDNVTRKNINELIQLVTRESDPDIPKLIIIDCCRGASGTEQIETAKLEKNNITLILSTSPGQTAWAMNYLPKLAERIERITSFRSIADIHTEVAEEVKNETKLRLEEGNLQTLKFEEKVKPECVDKIPKKKLDANGLLTLRKKSTVQLKNGNLTYTSKKGTARELEKVTFQSRQIPQILNTARHIELRKYYQDRSLCKECGKQIIPKNYITCTKCSSHVCIYCIMGFFQNDENFRLFLDEELNRNSLCRFLNYSKCFKICCRACSQKD